MNIIKLYKDSFAGLNKDIWLIGLIMFVNRIGTLILPFITLYTTKEIGWTKVEAGIAVSCFGFGSLAGSYLGGWLTDRIGYYKVFMYSLVLGGLAYFSLQYITSYVPLCIGLFIASTISDTLRPALYTGLRFFTDDSNRTRAISMLRMAFNLGFVVGPAIGGFLIAFTSYKWIFIIDAITCWGAAIVALKMMKDFSAQQLSSREEAVASNIKAPSPYRDYPFMAFMFFSLIMLVAFFQFLFTVPLYLEEISGFTADNIGIFYGVNGFLVFVVEMPLVHYIDQRKKIMPAMVLGSLMIGLGILALMVQSLIWLPLIVYMFLVSIGEIMNFPFISTTSLQRATDENSGKMMGINAVMFSLSLIIAPALGTWILDHYGYDILWISMSLLCVISALGIHKIKKYFVTQ